MWSLKFRLTFQLESKGWTLHIKKEKKSETWSKQRIPDIWGFSLFMHSDIRTNVKATSTGWINLKEQPGVWEKNTKTAHFPVNLKHSLCDVSNLWNGEDKQRFSLTHLWYQMISLLSEDHPLKKNYKPYPSVFSKQPHLTLPYVLLGETYISSPSSKMLS